jgi:hypothetical protein
MLFALNTQVENALSEEESISASLPTSACPQQIGMRVMQKSRNNIRLLFFRAESTYNVPEL